METNLIIFYITSCFIIIFALGTLFLRNLIYSLLCAISVFLLVSVIFYILGSEYNAVIQALVYGVAVPIIIGISIMFSSQKKKEKQNYFLLLILMFCAMAFLLLFADTVFISVLKSPETFRFTEVEQFNSFDVISSFARGIFIDYVWAFELLSLLLTIVIAGFTLFSGKLKAGNERLLKSRIEKNV